MRVRAILAPFGVVALLATVSLADGGPGAPDHRTKQVLPIKLGTSGGSTSDRSKAFCCGGTLGSAVLCNGVVHILSNNHVLGRSGAAVAGEDTAQPGLIDSGCRSSGSNIVADYAGNLVPLGAANVDAALALARPGAVSATGEIIDIGLPCATPRNAALQMAVAKSGRTSGLTLGTVEAVSLTVSVQYQRGCNSGKKSTVTFTNQVAVTPGSFLQAGDSGSLLVTNDASHQPVGLLYAGSSSVAIANPVQDVIDAFTGKCGGGFGFVGASCASTSSALTVPPGPTSSQLELAARVKERHVARLMSTPAVLGVGVGAADDDPHEAVLVLYLEQGRVHPPLPKAIDGVRVRVVRTDRIVAM